ncbi:MAG TPA: hypothetical protein VNK48_14345 [Xanthobacteraceae bacterium]|nr:hypothetical protein [Xanthobacteraceae bacterium]
MKTLTLSVAIAALSSFSAVAQQGKTQQAASPEWHEKGCYVLYPATESKKHGVQYRAMLSCRGIDKHKFFDKFDQDQNATSGPSNDGPGLL